MMHVVLRVTGGNNRGLFSHVKLVWFETRARVHTSNNMAAAFDHEEGLLHQHQAAVECRSTLTFAFPVDTVMKHPELWGDVQPGALGTTRLWERFLLREVRRCRSCLLYTSPSPRDATLSRMPSSA